MRHDDSFRFFALRFFRAVALPGLLLGLCSCSDAAEEPSEARTGVAASALGENLGAKMLECDGDLHAAPNSTKVDWVSDVTLSPPTQASCLYNGVASCNEPGVTSAPGGKGSWRGTRIVDGVGTKDQDIFKSGKENDTSGWKVQPGSVGSAKYDISQAYLAAGGDGDPATNKAFLYIGMERLGNDGTTAFDFEFNQKPGKSHVPTRSVGDVLVTCEVQGSGGSGSAKLYVFVWDGAQFKPGPVPAGVQTAINLAPVDAGPWGFVNDKAAWVLGKIPQMQMAEAVMPIGPGGVTMPGVSACGGKAFVQVRTRSSSIATSDLKDATPIFPFVFGKPTATAELVPRCDQAVDYHASAVDPDGVAMSGASCEVSVRDAQGKVVKTAGPACDGTVALPPGTYTADIKVFDPNAAGCDVTSTTAPVVVAAPVAVTASMQGSCALGFDYSASVQGGAGTPQIAWEFSGPGPVTAQSPGSASGKATVTEAGHYTGTVTVTETRGGLTCTQTKTVEADVQSPVTLKLAPVSTALACPLSSDEITFQALAAGGSGNFTYAWSVPGCSSSQCTFKPDALLCATGTVEVTVSDGICPDKPKAIGSYEKKTTVTVTVP
jgi:hypothetical protein